jgi:hypothetical protein
MLKTAGARYRGWEGGEPFALDDEGFGGVGGGGGDGWCGFAAQISCECLVGAEVSRF